VRHLHLLLLGGLTLAAFVLRLAGIDQALFGDELFTWAGATRPSLGGMLDYVRTSGDELNPPLFYVLAWLAAKLGDPTLTLRLPSLAAGTLTVPLVYALGVRTVGRGAALLGAALVAIGPFAVFYGTEARAYALLACLVTLSSLTLLRALETPSPGRWALFVLASCAALYTHYTAVLVLGAQAAWAAWAHRERLRELLIAHAAVVVGYLPWLPSQITQRRVVGGEGIIEELEPLTLGSVARSVLKLVPGHPFAPLRELPGRVALAALLIALAVALAALVAERRCRRPLPAPVLLIVALALATPVGALLYSLVSTSIFLPRNLIASLPAVCILIGALLVRERAPLRQLAIGVVLAAVGLGTLRSLGDDFDRPPYGRVADFLEREAEPSDVAVEVQAGVDEPSLALEVELGPPPHLYRITPRHPTLPPAALRARRIRLVVPRAGILAIRARPAALTRRFRRTGSRVYPGLVPIAVETYVRRG